MTCKKVIVDSRLSAKCCEKLQKMGYELVFMPRISVLDTPICAHPDMSVIKIKQKWFAASDVHDTFTFLSSCEFVSRADGVQNNLSYPFDVAFNGAVVGKKLICNSKYISRRILDYAVKSDYEIVDVKQGYTKCSVCVVDDNSIITEDKGVADKCAAAGIDVLLLKTHGVKLDGFENGFFGGCSGKLSDGHLVFAGCIKSHAEYREILKFCTERGVEPVSLSDEPLYDVGSIIEVP